MSQSLVPKLYCKAQADRCTCTLNLKCLNTLCIWSQMWKSLRSILVVVYFTHVHSFWEVVSYLCILAIYMYTYSAKKWCIWERYMCWKLPCLQSYTSVIVLWLQAKSELHMVLYTEQQEYKFNRYNCLQVKLSHVDYKYHEYTCIHYTVCPRVQSKYFWQVNMDATEILSMSHFLSHACLLQMNNNSYLTPCMLTVTPVPVNCHNCRDTLCNIISSHHILLIRWAHIYEWKLVGEQVQLTDCSWAWGGLNFAHACWLCIDESCIVCTSSGDKGECSTSTIEMT